jgi:hypothetical protein
MAQDSENVYWISDGTPGEDPPGVLARAPKDAIDGGAVPLAYQLASPRGIAVVSPTVFYAEWGLATDGGAQTEGRISRITGSTIPVIVVGSQAQPSPLTADEKDLYWGNQGDGTIRRCAIAGCNGQPATIAEGQLLPSSIAVDEKAVYWATLGGSVVMIAK